MILSNRSHLYIAAATHPGMKGKNNEDRYGVSAHRLGERGRDPSLLATVCDGIGGHRAGEVAAEMAVEIISRTVAESDAHNPLAILRLAITRASQAIHEQAEREPAQAGMGATCTCAWVIGDRLFVAYVGDSRMYLLRGDTIRQLTTDHTWVQEAIEFGALTPEQARGHPNAHVIRRYLGSASPAAVDFRLRLHQGETDEQAEANQGMQILPGDRLLLCSDGLTDLVDNEEVLDALTERPREAALQYLVGLANERGGHDNITIVVLEAPPDERTVPVPRNRSRRRWLTFSCVSALALIIVALLLAALGWMYFNGWLSGASEQATTTPVVSETAPLQSTPQPTASETATLAPPAQQAATPSATSAASATSTPTSPPLPPVATYTPWPTNAPVNGGQ